MMLDEDGDKIATVGSEAGEATEALISRTRSQKELKDQLFVSEGSERGSKKDIQTLDSIVTLKNIELKILKGEFVCIIGDVGSGKSSLLSTLIGDLLYVSPA